MTVFELLKKDHEKVSAMFEQIGETTERAVKTREELFPRLKMELDVHAELEETILYPALEQYDETRDIALEGYEEHRLVKMLLSELEQMPVESEEWTAKFTVLKENVEHHVEEEEDEMFKKAEQVLSKEQIEEITTRIESQKKTMKASMQG